MNIVTRICKNCGKTYEACRTAPSDPGVYRWQDVACSPQCGAAYLAAVLKARHMDDQTAALEERNGKTVVVQKTVEAEAEAEAPDAAQKRSRKKK